MLLFNFWHFYLREFSGHLKVFKSCFCYSMAIEKKFVCTYFIVLTLLALIFNDFAEIGNFQKCFLQLDTKSCLHVAKALFQFL